MNYIVNKKINKASFFLLLCYVALFIFLVLQTYGFGSANIDYKQLSSQESCLYSLNQIDFYDLDEEGKSLVVTKEFITSVKNYENFKCVNKVIEINDGWPEIRIKVGEDSPSSTNYAVDIHDGDGNRVGSITFNGSGTAFNTSSDYRLKHNIADLTDATTKIKELKPKKFSWIRDKNNTLVNGFLAHEVSSVIPDAVIGDKDAKDADGNPEYQQIDHSKFVPLLVKTIQELEARITALEDK